MKDGFDKETKQNIDFRAAADYFRQASEWHRNEAKLQMKVFMITGVVVLSLVVIAMGIYAWFSMNSSVTATGMKVSTEDQAVSPGDYVVYKHNTTTGEYEHFDYETYVKEGNVIEMNTLDVLWDEQYDTALYFRIPIKTTILEEAQTSEYNKIRFLIACSSKATWKDITDPYDPEDESTRRYLSSVIQVKAGLYPTIDKGTYESSKEDEYFYTSAKAAMLNQTARSFVTIDSSTGTPSYTERSIYYDFNVTDIETVDGKAYVYLEIDYCNPLVKKYLMIDGEYYGIDKSVNLDQFYQDFLDMDFIILK